MRILTILAAMCCATAMAGEPALHSTHDSASLEWGPCPPFFAEGCGVAVLHANEDGTGADVFFRYPAGESFVEHWHTSAERMVLVQGRMDVTYEGQDTTTLNVGDYAFGPAKHKHHGACVSDDDCILFIAFNQAIDAHEVASTD